jgi:hypothetical protein
MLIWVFTSILKGFAARFIRLWRDLSASGAIYPPLARFIRLWRDLSASGEIYNYFSR